MLSARKAPPQQVAEKDFVDRQERDTTIAMVVAAGKSPAAVADHFNLTIGDVRRLVRRVRERAR